MNKLYINWRIAVISILLFGLILGARLLSPSAEIVYCGGCLLVIIGIGYNGIKRNDKQTAAFFLVLPIFFSAFQNVYLGWAADQLVPTELQVLLSFNILIVVIGVCITFFKRKSCVHYVLCTFILVILLFYSVILYCLYPSNLVAFASSLRNIISCICVYMLTLRICEKADINIIFKLLNAICLIVISVGLIELLWKDSLWTKLNIDILWPLKGIKINKSTGVPSNWYSSEKINGIPIRRMVSTFADPVNLGSYLFAMFMVAWYQNKKWFGFLIIYACVLTVSKGALLGFLIFAVIYVIFKDRTKIFAIIVSGITLAAGIVFIQLTTVYSSGSTMFHIKQFFFSFQILKNNMLGMGVGNAGVLAGLVYGLENISIGETGIGVIAAQMGIIGLVVYIVFMCILVKIPYKYCYPGNFKEKVLYYTLLCSFVANAMFNEVALSINSCAVYFLMLGILTGLMMNKYRIEHC